jgi:tetratricopeptide (TPR) repeat protein
MKSERRRELRQNALIWHLQGLPEKIKQYQSQISLVLIVIALGVVLIQYRMRTAEEKLDAAREAVAIATQDFNQLQSTLGVVRDPAMGMRQREEWYADGIQQTQDALQKAPDTQQFLKAHALLIKGDLSFEMSNLPEMPGASTQPALRPAESMDDLLSAASDAYSQALQTYGDIPSVAVSARFGLAAVAENQSQWDAARQQYQAIISSNAAQPYKDYAKQRMDLLDQLQRPAAVDFSATTQPTTATVGPIAPTTK